MKHTIKLLTLVFMLATILTLTGCPGPVNNYIEPPVVPEYTITVNVTNGTAEYPAKAKAGDPVTITATAEEGFTFDGASSAFDIPDCSLSSDRKVITWNFSMFAEDVVINVAFKHEHIWEEITTDETKAATCTEDGLAVYKCKTCGAIEKRTTNKLGHVWVLESDTATCTEDGVKTYKCSRCNETRTEDSPAHHTFIAGGCDKCGAYEYSGTQVKVYVYTFTEDKELNDLGILYYSFEETDKTMELNNLLHLKPTYKDYTVVYCEYYFNPNKKDNLKNVNPYIPWEDKLNSPIGIIIEPTN